MIGRQTPPALLPLATIPIAKAFRRLKYWPTTVMAGLIPKPTVKPKSRPWVRNCCHILFGWLKEKAKSDPEQPKAATGYKNCKKKRYMREICSVPMSAITDGE
ncbi:hypothetical protein T310_0409 [Rasamsonia emersonii CBS 393.64]|uniref:Uncharacterized protein n=1 Tax=Rasamsonia emersonii (strain ATCC 16479 / CBS 393.64 / IMI 116815) TaxID=1408163 RepID=A0A0F4Z4S2_RASE3|nr:hypothetical protein T310_0409 [Rasamsonia emersonii CBS 393.64]KKA25529.1 hypothetical protein T310_0409 [Rasamsonia emersonii CBS 393.64]